MNVWLSPLPSGHLQIVKLLVSRSADAMCRDKRGYTPLHAAAASGQIEVVKYLLRLGSEVRGQGVGLHTVTIIRSLNLSCGFLLLNSLLVCLKKKKKMFLQRCIPSIIFRLGPIREIFRPYNHPISHHHVTISFLPFLCLHVRLMSLTPLGTQRSTWRATRARRRWPTSW